MAADSVFRILAGTALALCAVGLIPRPVLAGETGRPPNIVIFLADDQGWGDLSLNGNTNLATPNIDSLGRQGAVLDRFYACAVCAPTRAEFLTGRYHPRTGVRGVSTGEERLDIGERTLADVLRAAGYATGAFGKWHNGTQWPYHPKARGFDDYVGFTSGHWAEYFDPLLDHNGEFKRAKGYISDIFTDHALAFIERNRAHPFFCYIPYNTPHSPFGVPAEDWARFKDRPIALRGQDGGQETVDITRAALAMCENLDRNVGRVLQRLDQLRLSENTIVIYFSDNGPNSFRWNGGMKGRKGSVDEGGVRVPFVMRWPAKIKPGTVVTDITGAIDLLPTLARLAGATIPADRPIDGRDLSPLLLERRNVNWPERLIFSHHNGRISVRSPRYRLDHTGALFDLEADPRQTRNLATEQPDVARALAAAVAGWRRDIVDTSPREPRPFPVGYREFPITHLPARDGIAHGGVKRSSSAPNASFFTHWTQPEDRITWDVAVRTSGEYDAVLYYTCRPADVGAIVELSLNGQRTSSRVTEAWDPPVHPHQDTLPRPPAESPAKDFRPLSLGSIRLEAGRGPLTLRAIDIPGAGVVDVRLLTLTLRP